MRCDKRFKDLAESKGFKLTKVFGRNDILKVRYHGYPVMTIPKKLYAFSSYSHNLIHPDYFDREKKLKQWNFILKRTPHLKEYDETERKLKSL